MRSIPKWIGATDEARAPDSVRLRVFRLYGGRCYLTGRRIMPLLDAGLVFARAGRLALTVDGYAAAKTLPVTPTFAVRETGKPSPTYYFDAAS